MNLQKILGLYFTIVALSSLTKTQAQQFNNYSQNIPNENFSIDVVAVKGGEFSMGTDSNDTSRNEDEKPEHKINVDDFWMGKYEITWDQYDAFVFGEFDAGQFKSKEELIKLGIDGISGATTPYVEMSFGMGKEDHPAVNITQYAALMYCKWLTSKTGIFFRLPTEAEWEYVCKTGNTDSSSQNLNDTAWYTENTNDKYEKTGQKKPNNLGIYDMLGNVSEWVLDKYDGDYYMNSPTSNPWNVATELYPRVVRGGSWKDTKDKICCTYRGASKSKWKRRDPQIPKSNWWHTNAEFVGFRIVRPKKQPSLEEIKKYWQDAIEDFGLN